MYPTTEIIENSECGEWLVNESRRRELPIWQRLRRDKSELTKSAENLPNPVYIRVPGTLGLPARIVTVRQERREEERKKTSIYSSLFSPGNNRRERKFREGFWLGTVRLPVCPG